MILSEKIANDVKLIEQELREQGIESVFQHTYELSFYYQVAWFFEDIEENLEDDDLAYFDILHTYEGNIPRDIFHQFESYSNPEYYNFNTYEGINDIIRYFVDTLKKKQGETK